MKTFVHRKLAATLEVLIAHVTLLCTTASMLGVMFGEIAFIPKALITNNALVWMRS